MLEGNMQGSTHPETLTFSYYKSASLTQWRNIKPSTLGMAKD